MSELLRNAMDAYIDPRKLRDYALNINHDSGRFKAAFFAQMGYDAENWQLLERDIREQHLTTGAERGSASSFGIKYNIIAPLVGPNGESRWVTTVWIFRAGEAFADLVTIEPAKRRRSVEDE